MKVPSDKPVNDEDFLPLPKDFAERAKKVLEARKKRDSLLAKRLKIYGASLAKRILRDHPDITVEEVIDMVNDMT